MAKVLKEYFGEVKSADAYAYGYGPIRDHLTYPYGEGRLRLGDYQSAVPAGQGICAAIIPGSQAWHRDLGPHGVPGKLGRYNAIFREKPPTKFAQFVERVPMVKGRLDSKATTATGYAWLVWEKESPCEPRLMWVPPCRKKLANVGLSCLNSGTCNYGISLWRSPHRRTAGCV